MPVTGARARKVMKETARGRGRIGTVHAASGLGLAAIQSGESFHSSSNALLLKTVQLSAAGGRRGRKRGYPRKATFRTRAASNQRAGMGEKRRERCGLDSGRIWS
ncbi:hypothetical protein NDU88_001134 [Pleurodeles waltl]|uniref:Uncharacterized protein n=1 Tax=Pleurodeles waltl TaxID=8319 RepID=A0AAV7LWR9_PLEWA|nr:hypothetical protein NDU88_001134 [Pleurodeles waltl]